MNYKRVYDNLIESRQNLNRSKKDEYYETHHIIPRSLGGSNDKSNLINLTSKEHFLAHWLLYKMHSGQDKSKMAYALFMMCSNNPNQKRVIAGRQYEIAKTAMASSCSKENNPNYQKQVWSEEQKMRISERQSGTSNSMYGKTPWNKGTTGFKHTEVTKLKMSIAHSGKQFSNETRKKLSDAHSGKTLSEETKEKLRQANLGKKLSPESIQKTALANRGKKQEILTCPYCQKTGGNTMHRWHFENCREKS